MARNNLIFSKVGTAVVLKSFSSTKFIMYCVTFQFIILKGICQITYDQENSCFHNQSM